MNILHFHFQLQLQRHTSVAATHLLLRETHTLTMLEVGWNFEIFRRRTDWSSRPLALTVADTIFIPAPTPAGRGPGPGGSLA
jgi:hypothetical protein